MCECCSTTGSRTSSSSIGINGAPASRIRRLYQDVLDLAARAGDAGLAQTIQGFGEPPYGDVFATAFVMQQYDALYQPYSPPESVQQLAAAHASEVGPWGVLGREYNLVEKVSVMRGLMDMFATMYPQLQNIDFRRDVPRLEVPYYMLDGAAELSARRDVIVPETAASGL